IAPSSIFSLPWSGQARQDGCSDLAPPAVPQRAEPASATGESHRNRLPRLFPLLSSRGCSMRLLSSLLLFSLLPCLAGAAPAPIYLWHEPEWFDGVRGGFAYWTGAAKPTGAWGIAGPGISAE